MGPKATGRLRYYQPQSSAPASYFLHSTNCTSDQTVLKRHPREAAARPHILEQVSFPKGHTGQVCSLPWSTAGAMGRGHKQLPKPHPPWSQASSDAGCLLPLAVLCKHSHPHQLGGRNSHLLGTTRCQALKSRATPPIPYWHGGHIPGIQSE